MIKKKTKYIQVDQFVAEVEIELIVEDHDWAPYLSFQTAKKLDQIRESLEKKDYKQASKFAKIYKMQPVV